MNAPATAAEFLALVRKSGIVDDKRFAVYLEKSRLTSPLPSDAQKLAERLVHDGLLTHFQAEQFLQGKWRRFTIGKYKVLERIGAGGMGSVFLCEHKLMRRRVAVKVLPTSQSHDPSALQRFYREARAVAALDHPNIVRAYDIDQEDNLHFLVMEYVDGSSLQEIVQRVGPFDPVRAAHYISQAALGLQHAHEVAGLVHRDIKPGNIILDRNGTVKVLDLGLARFFFDDEDLLTKHYDENVLGTADYLAPEQALNSHTVDIRGDIYSLGGTFYFCLTGQTPFGEGSVAQKLIWHQSRQPKPIRSFRSDVPEEMIAVINRMMAKDPQQRYQAPLEVAQDLDPWTQISIPPPAEAEMPRLSRAARGNGPAETGVTQLGALPLPSPSSRTRKIWQVPSIPGRQPSPGLASSQAPATKPEPVISGLSPLKTGGQQSLAVPPSDAPPVIAEAVRAVAKPVLPAELKLAATEDEEGNAQPQPHAVADEEEDDAPPWSPPAAETENLTAKADTDIHSRKNVTARRLRKARALERAREKRRRMVWWCSGIAGGLLVICAGFLVWALTAHRKTETIAAPVSRPPLFVSHTGKQGFRTIGEAIYKAQDEDHIVALDDVEEQLELTGAKKVLVIEPAPGKTVVWRFPLHVASGVQLVALNNVGHLRIRGFTFEGNNRVDRIMTITGHSPGLTLEDVRLRGFRYSAIVMANAAGTADEPITFDRVQAHTLEKRQAAVMLLADTRLSSPRINEHITFKDCRFDGAAKEAVQLLGGPSIVKDIAFLRTKPPDLIKETH